MRLLSLVLVMALGCETVDVPSDGAVTPDARSLCSGPYDLYGEPCTQPDFPQIGGCRPNRYAVGGFDGVCHDEASGPVCRPWCYADGADDCTRRGGRMAPTDRGACACVPCT